MIKVENIETWGFEHAIRGMRNPLNSWDRSDTIFELVLRHDKEHAHVEACIGKNDINLMKKLYKAGTEHRKYLRQIFVSMDITAPLYWWKEFDTYKIGTVANSCSTMHKIHSKEFDINDFSHDTIEELEGEEYNRAWENWINTINELNYFRDKFNETKNKLYWRQMIEKLPSSYNQKRTVTMNYENVVSMINQREHHKLDEWVDFTHTLRTLPYIGELLEND
mgnify:CR=1 FL=1